jgi:hypothetical protein
MWVNLSFPANLEIRRSTSRDVEFVRVVGCAYRGKDDLLVETRD